MLELTSRAALKLPHALAFLKHMGWAVHGSGRGHACCGTALSCSSWTGVRVCPCLALTLTRATFVRTNSDAMYVQTEQRPLATVAARLVHQASASPRRRQGSSSAVWLEHVLVLHSAEACVPMEFQCLNMHLAFA